MQGNSYGAKVDSPAGRPEGRRPRLRRANLLPYALIGPIALLLLAISVYPSLYAIWLAMTDASLLRLAKAQFIGIDNFVRLAGDSIFLDSLWRTLRWDVAVVLSELLIALPIALFLNLTFRGRGFVRVAMMIPYITPPAVVALLFAYMFDGNFGVVNDLLVKVGLLDRYVSWLSDPTGSFAVTVAAMVWYGQPLMALILLAALQTIPQALYDAANVDGASAWQRFRYITLPHLMPSILFLVLLRLIWMSNHIDMIFVLTQGRARIRQLHRGGLQLQAHQPVRDRLRVGGRGRADDPAGGRLGDVRAAPRTQSAGIGMTSGSKPSATTALLDDPRRGGGPRLFAGAFRVDRDRVDHAGNQGLRLAERPPGPATFRIGRRSTTTSTSSPIIRSRSTSATARSSPRATCC